MPATKCFCNQKGKCTKDCGRNSELSKLKVKIGKFGYLGGAYGPCDKDEMKKELKNGPFVVSFKPSDSFMTYKKGIFKGEPGMVGKKDEWVNIDHSVLLVGYGKGHDGTDYWICLNSYGKDWGDKGLFKIKAGSNYQGIESHCEASDVYLANDKGMIK